MADVRPYLFYDTAISICSICYRRAEGKIVFEDGCVYLLKRCPVHGPERVLMADDIDYYRRCREIFLKPPEMPRQYNMPVIINVVRHQHALGAMHGTPFQKIDAAVFKNDLAFRAAIANG